MQAVSSSKAGTSGRKSVCRILLILGSLLPALHLSGMDLFERTSSEVLAASNTSDLSELMPFPSSPMEFQATAYSDFGITKSGVVTRTGLVAGDPALLPLGSWIQIQEGAPEQHGLYQVMDTGRLIKGAIIDIYMPTLEQAVRFGRKKVRISVVKYGPAKMMPLLSWDPDSTSFRPEFLVRSISDSSPACF